MRKKKEKLIKPKNKNVSVRIPIELYEEYQDARAKAEEFSVKVSLSAIIRNGVEEYIEKIRAAEGRLKSLR